jgi:hypothetical protein
VKDRKHSRAYEAGYKAGAALVDTLTGLLHRFLRPHVGRIIEEMFERMQFEGECEDEDIPDCAHCEHHGHCPYEPHVPYEPPPGYVLLRPGPPPHPWDIN